MQRRIVVKNFHFLPSSSIPHDDSGHISFYDPELCNQETQVLMGALLPSQDEDGSRSSSSSRSPSLDPSKTPGDRGQVGGAQTWVNTDFYAQVSNVTPSGGVVLSPGQQLRIQESMTDAQKKASEAKDAEDVAEKKEVEQRPQLLLMDPEGSGYTTESSARQFHTPPCSPEPVEGPKATNPQAAATAGRPSPYILPDPPQTQAFAPVADYTVVQELDSQHSLLLNPPPRHSAPPPPPPAGPQNPVKALPALPVGYVTPDLLGNLAP